MLANLLIGNGVFFGILALLFYFSINNCKSEINELKGQYLWSIITEEECDQKIKEERKRITFYLWRFVICLIIFINCVVIGSVIK